MNIIIAEYHYSIDSNFKYTISLIKFNSSSFFVD